MCPTSFYYCSSQTYQTITAGVQVTWLLPLHNTLGSFVSCNLLLVTCNIVIFDYPPPSKLCSTQKPQTVTARVKVTWLLPLHNTLGSFVSCNLLLVSCNIVIFDYPPPSKLCSSQKPQTVTAGVQVTWLLPLHNTLWSFVSCFLLLLSCNIVIFDYPPPLYLLVTDTSNHNCRGGSDVAATLTQHPGVFCVIFPSVVVM
ncbi:hypothetical protein J6590_068511 [Homalodisca vitripennis]|nr:hypothetical protein J6590_068511 [Homalodisca vitripennis]